MDEPLTHQYSLSQSSRKEELIVTIRGYYDILDLPFTQKEVVIPMG